MVKRLHDFVKLCYWIILCQIDDNIDEGENCIRIISIHEALLLTRVTFFDYVILFPTTCLKFASMNLLNMISNPQLMKRSRFIV